MLSVTMFMCIKMLELASCKLSFFYAFHIFGHGYDNTTKKLCRDTSATGTIILKLKTYLKKKKSSMCQNCELFVIQCLHCQNLLPLSKFVTKVLSVPVPFDRVEFTFWERCVDVFFHSAKIVNKLATCIFCIMPGWEVFS